MKKFESLIATVGGLTGSASSFYVWVQHATSILALITGFFGLGIAILSFGWWIKRWVEHARKTGWFKKNK